MNFQDEKISDLQGEVDALSRCMTNDGLEEERKTWVSLRECMFVNWNYCFVCLIVYMIFVYVVIETYFLRWTVWQNFLRN